MTAHILRFKVTLPVRSPHLFPAAGPTPLGLDAAPLRTPDQALILPGEHLRGHLRHAALAGAETGELDRELVSVLFGNPSPGRTDDPDEQDIPARGCLQVGDLVARPEVGQAGLTWLYHRVSIDDQTGAADDGMLQVLGLGAPLGQISAFSGEIELKARPGSALPDLHTTQELILDLLRAIPAVGAYKSSGFGEIVTKAISVEPVKIMSDPAISGSHGLRVVVDVEIDGVLLIDTIRRGWNSLESSKIIPGGAIKGLLATALEAEGATASQREALSRLHVSHAYPLASAAVRSGRPIPLSLGVALIQGQPAELAHCFTDTDVAHLATQGAVSFKPDWKHSLEVALARVLDRPAAELTSQLRGRVAIGEDGTAVDRALFTTKVLQTTREDGSPILWRFELASQGAPDFLRKCLEILSGGMRGLGRTAARLRAVRATQAAPPDELPASGPVRIMLETDALLTDAADTSPDWQDQYHKAFSLILGEGVRSVKAVAQREYRGDYLAHRFPQSETGYLPYEITQAGGCFELDLEAGSAARTALQACLEKGLQPIFNGRVLRADGWKQCPFMNQNGYGAISLLPACPDLAAVIKALREQEIP